MSRLVNGHEKKKDAPYSPGLKCAPPRISSLCAQFSMSLKYSFMSARICCPAESRLASHTSRAFISSGSFIGGDHLLPSSVLKHSRYAMGNVYSSLEQLIILFK